MLETSTFEFKKCKTNVEKSRGITPFYVFESDKAFLWTLSFMKGILMEVKAKSENESSK